MLYELFTADIVFYKQIKKGKLGEFLTIFRRKNFVCSVVDVARDAMKIVIYLFSFG